jgi:hypothetical protein
MWLGSLLLHALIWLVFIYVSSSHDVKYTSLFFRFKHKFFIHCIASYGFVSLALMMKAAFGVFWQFEYFYVLHYLDCQKMVLNMLPYYWF